MPTFVRISLLGAFLAIGAGVAVAFARYTESNPWQLPTVAGAEGSAPLDSAKPATSGASDARQPLVLAERADYQPAVATQIPRPTNKPPSAVDATAARQAEVLDRTLDLLKDALQNRPPAGGERLPLPASAEPNRAGTAANDAVVTPTNNLSNQTGDKRTSITDEGDEQLRINLKDSDIREVLELLSQEGQLNILASPNVTGTVSASLVRVNVHEALEAILKSTGFSHRNEGNMIYVGTKEEVAEIGHFREPIGTRVYRPNYVRAEELQRLISPLLTEGIGQATINTGGAGGGNANLGGNQAISRIASTTPAQRGIQSNTAEAGGDDYAGSDLLLVRDYQSVLEQVDRVVQTADRQPLQVSIEAMILSVRLDDRNNRGVNFEALRDRSHVRLISGTPPSNLADISVTEGGLKLGFLDQSLSAFINALETVGDTNVVASPRLLCMNKQRAEILIGSELGYVSTTVTESASTQSVEFLEVGTQLRLRPFISSDGMVRLEVHPELSTGSVRVEQGFTLPDKEVTQVTTNVLCPDACTVVLGGLMREDLVTTTSQIPLLGNLPIFGPVFRQKTEKTEKREIIVLLTPRIMFNETLCKEGAQGASDFLQRQSIYADKMSPLGKRHYGRHYQRLARAAWAAGDARAALRFVNLAVHFDPLNLETIQLRNEIMAGSNQGDRTIHSHLREGLVPWQHPQRDYSRHGFPWQGPPRYQPPIPIDPDALPHPAQPIETKRENIVGPQRARAQ